MHTVRRLMDIARPYAGKLLLVALLTSVGALAELVEPWVYRAIINDLAGVFVSRETGLLPQILEELRGGPEETEPEGTPSGSAPETTTPEKEPPSVPASEPAAPAAPATQALAPTTKYKPATAARRRSRRRRLTRAQRSAEIKSLVGPILKPPPVPPRTVSYTIRTLWLGVLVLLGAAGLAKVFAAMADLLAASTTNQIEEGFILKTLRHVLRLPFSYFTRRPSGAIARQIDQSDQIAPLFSALTQEVWSEAFTAVTILVVIFSVNAQLASIVLVALLVYLLVTIRMTHHLETHLEEYYGLWDDVAGRIQETVSGIKTVHAHANEEYEMQRTTKTVKEAFRTYLRRQQVETRYTFLQNTLIYISKGLILGLGGMKALEHQLTPGDVVMFMAYLDRIYSPVNNLTNLYAVIQRHIVSLHRAFRLHDVKEEDRGDRQVIEVREGRVEFRDVDFHYREGRPVLRRLNFTMNPGEVTALIGPSGVGKTTTADLLLQLYQPQGGTILVDGHDLRTVDLDSWRKQVVAVSAEGTIFRDTLAQNIRYSRLEATDEEVQAAALQAGLAGAIERLPEGLHTVLGERGYELSMGERQRVLLARAFVANPRILVLDEATANLDFKTEDAVKKTLRELTRGRTTLIIAHRQSMLTEVDRVVAIREGRVIEEGPPEVLFGQRGYFFQMMTARPQGPELHVQ
ncbi:MAG: ABC transporter ATP-binding protein/permease [Acidobacteriia bacterium]|nr:ABC transporter ATP-binding protein/permease [Terriglobia bacterium]